MCMQVYYVEISTGKLWIYVMYGYELLLLSRSSIIIVDLALIKIYRTLNFFKLKFKSMIYVVLSYFFCCNYCSGWGEGWGELFLCVDLYGNSHTNRFQVLSILVHIDANAARHFKRNQICVIGWYAKFSDL